MFVLCVFAVLIVLKMSFNREPNKRKSDSADVLPSTSPTPRRSDAAIMADDLSQLAERINWPRLPELKEFEQMAELILSAGYYSSEELADTSPTERQQLYKLLADGRPGWSRLLRKILGAKAPPIEVETKKALPFTEIDIFAAIKNHPTLYGLGELLRPRQEAVNIFSEAMYEGSKAIPPYIPFVAPKLWEAPWALQDPTHKRAAESERSRQKRNAVKTSFLNTGQLALTYLRYIMAGELSGAWTKFGGLGAMLTNLASIMELSVLQNMETACRFERTQSAAWSHLARERGSLQTIKEELVKVNRDRLHQVVNDQVSEFSERLKRREGGNPGSSTRPRARNNKRARSPRRGYYQESFSKRRPPNRNRSPRDKQDNKSSSYNSPDVKKDKEPKKDSQKGKKAPRDYV